MTEHVSPSPADPRARPATWEGVRSRAREGAASVFRYLVREAQPVGDGVTWRTLSTTNEARCDPNLYNGVAGVSLFLSDYFRVTGDPLAVELATGALRWCAAPERPPTTEPLGQALPHSLYSGSAGLGLAWLRLALATAPSAAGGEEASPGRTGHARGAGDEVADRDAGSEASRRGGATWADGAAGSEGSPHGGTAWAVAGTGSEGSRHGGVAGAHGSAKSGADRGGGDAGADGGTPLDRAAALGSLLAEQESGPWADLPRGALGEGLFLLRLWEATGDPLHLTGARRRGEWFRDTAIRDALGCHWLRVTEAGNPRHLSLTGLHTGNAGIGHFLLALGAATGEAQWTALAHEGADTLLRQARPSVPDGAGLDWPYAVGGADLARCQWCAGAPGIGYFLVEAERGLGSPDYLAAAERAGETVFAHGDWRRNPSQCHGLAGSAELFRVLALRTGSALWLERLQRFTAGTLAYRTATATALGTVPPNAPGTRMGPATGTPRVKPGVTTANAAAAGAAPGPVPGATSDAPAGDSWQGDEPGLTSPDFFCGAAGVGHFFLRLLAPGTLRVPYL